MSNLSINRFIDKYLPLLQKDPDFAVHIKVANVLIKKYNKSIFLDSYKNIIKDSEPSLWQTIEFLWKNGLWDKKYLKALEKELEKQDSSLSFTLQSPSNSKEKIYKKVNNFLDSKFKEYTLKNNEQEQLWINLKGNGYQYKRNLESDLNILLK
jgi:hypothetical protein